MAISLVSLENAPYADGKALQAILSGPPTGALRFYASRDPVVVVTPGNLVPHDVVNPTTYKLNLRSAGQTPLLHRLDYWVIAADVGGATNERVEWLCYGDNRDWLQLISLSLNDILVSRVAALDRTLVLWLEKNEWPLGTTAVVEDIHQGEPYTGTGKVPAVCFQAQNLAEDHWGLPYSDKIDFSFKIECYAYWQERQPWHGLLHALGMGVWNLLNQQQHLVLELENAMRVYDTFCRNGSYTEYWDEAAGAFISTFTLEWNGFLNAGAYDLETA